MERKVRVRGGEGGGMAMQGSFCLVLNRHGNSVISRAGRCHCDMEVLMRCVPPAKPALFLQVPVKLSGYCGSTTAIMFILLVLF